MRIKKSDLRFVVNESWLFNRIRKKRSYPYAQKTLFLKVEHPAVFLLGTPTYNNIGDHAIAEAERAFIQKHWDGCFEEVTLEDMYLCFDELCSEIMDKDILCVQGGGNIGLEYYEAELMRRILVKTFPRNKILFFPQTIYYGDNVFSPVSLWKAKRIYTKHCDLHVFARDKTSYRVGKKLFVNNDVHFVPDIVMQAKFNYKHQQQRSSDVIFCLRNDIESVLTEQDKAYLLQEILVFGNVQKVDMTANTNFSPQSRLEGITEKLEKFSTARAVITDRIHGMIFAALTGTPCIALTNYNHKVKETSEIITPHCPYIRFAEKKEDAVHLLKEIWNKEGQRTPLHLGDSLYAPIIKLLEKV